MTDRDRNTDSPKATAEAAAAVSDASPSPGSTVPDNKKAPIGFAEPCRPRPPTSSCLDKTYVEIDGMCFQNMDDAITAMNHALWHAPANDATIPQTDEDHRRVAKQLADAFKDMATAKDTEGNAYRKRLTKGEDVYYSDWAIEACAWNIVKMVKSIHTEGFKVPIYDRTILDSIGQTKLWTFQERIDWICLVLKTSKNIAVTLMKHEKTWTTIGAPHKLYSSTLVNFVSNGQRNNWVKAGREADADHQSRPTKRQRTATTARTNTNASTRPASNDTGTGNTTTNGNNLKTNDKTAPGPDLARKNTSLNTTAAAATSDVSSTPKSTATSANFSSSAKQIATNVDMMDADSDQLAKKNSNNMNGDAVLKRGDQVGTKDDSNGQVKNAVKDNEGSRSAASTTSSQKTLATNAHPKNSGKMTSNNKSSNDMHPRDAQTIEAAHLLAALHTAVK